MLIIAVTAGGVGMIVCVILALKKMVDPVRLGSAEEEQEEKREKDRGVPRD